MPRIFNALKVLGETQAQLVREALAEERIELEAWPVQEEDGRLTWVFARWRRDSEQEWHWLDARDVPAKEGGSGHSRTKSGPPGPILPKSKYPRLPEDFVRLFEDPLNSKDLYFKPAFSDGIWTNPTGSRFYGAWFSPNLLNEVRNYFERNTDSPLVCRVCPQPARLNGKPVSFVVKASKSGVEWPAEIEWREDVDPTAAIVEQRIFSWPRNFERAYENDVRRLSGDKITVFPYTGKKIRFTKKNSADPENQLEAMVTYLEARYRKLGLSASRQSFEWRGITQTNLVVVIPGSLPPEKNRPVILADHIDTAFAEDIFRKKGKRVSVPGADDNVTGSAALLRAAEILRQSQPEHDIWPLHLTAEEFPADSLGARQMVTSLLESKTQITGFLLLDMIGYAAREDRVFQINSAQSPESMAIAMNALDAARIHAPELMAVLRKRFDEKSYLYNTDGIIFSDAGFAGVLFNERINRLENLNRRHYHHSTDKVEHLDYEYATAITKVVIETVARMAGTKILKKQ